MLLLLLLLCFLDETLLPMCRASGSPLVLEEGGVEERSPLTYCMFTVCRLVATNLQRKSAHALTFGGDFELKFHAWANSCRKICDNQPANLCKSSQQISTHAQTDR